MAELFIELLSEELPASLQAEAEEKFASLLNKELLGAGVPTGAIRTGSTPRRLVVSIDGIPPVLPARTVEKLGPKTNSNEKIVAAFLKANGSDQSDLTIKTTSKGEQYVLNQAIPARRTAQVLVFVIDKSIRSMPWMKSMHWGSATFRWPRPLVNIAAVFDGEPLKYTFDLGNGIGIEYTNRSIGHRFLNPETFTISDFAQYKNELASRHVILDRDERKAIIRKQAEDQAKATGVTLNKDEALLEEVVGLVEWPVALRGRFEEKFLRLPPEVITTSMRANQKYFSATDELGNLSSSFIFVAGTLTKDEGKAVVSGNERVISARLSDALFFWTNDVNVPLSERVPDLKTLKFHHKLGNMYDKTSRVVTLSNVIAKQLGANASLVERAAYLAKADLTTSLVYEFPELQGSVGYRCALAQGEPPTVAEAIRDHYGPLGPSDVCPKAEIAVVVALADKIDTLTGFFSAGEIPTSSRDPFSLRRTTLGIIRILLENNINYNLSEAVDLSSRLYGTRVPKGLHEFIGDRIRSTFLDRGLPDDVISAVLNNDTTGNVTRLLEEGKILGAFVNRMEGAKLLATETRVRKILPKGWNSAPYTIKEDYLISEYDAQLMSQIHQLEAQVLTQPFEEKLESLCNAVNVIEAFFQNVRINDDDEGVKENRIGMLSRLQHIFDDVCDLKSIKPRDTIRLVRPEPHSSCGALSLDKK